MPQDDSIYEKLRIKHGALEVRSYDLSFSDQNLARLLAKIGHAYTVAMLGVDGFKPYLTDIILKRPCSVPLSYLIGGARKPPIDQTVLHKLDMIMFETAEPYGYMAAANINLFPSFAFPTYRVVTGAVSPARATLIQQSWIRKSLTSIL